MTKVCKLLLLFLFPLICLAGVDFSTDSGDYLSHADNLGTDISGENQPISFCAWFRRDADSGSSEYILAKYTTTGNQRSYGMTVAGGATPDVVSMLLSDNGTNFLGCNGATAIATDGTWYQVCGVYNDTDMRVYLNGVLDAVVDENPRVYSGGVNSGTAPFSIGARNVNDTPAGDFAGVVNEVAVWDVALTVEEVVILASSKVKGMPLQIQPANLQFYAALDDVPEGTSVNTKIFIDKSSSRDDLTGTDSDSDSVAIGEVILSYP